VSAASRQLPLSRLGLA